MQALPVSKSSALSQLKNTITLPPNHLFPQPQPLLLYNAGVKFAGGPDYSRIFARDGLTSAFLLGDARFLHDLLVFCASTMGTKIDPRTGEEPGKVPHEWPGVDLRGYNTQYVAADTSALWLVGLYEYWLASKDSNFIASMRTPVRSALDYIRRHLHDDLFWDDPKYSQSAGTAVLSGCWRDGGFPERDGGRQTYPATYFMVNLLIVKALRGLHALRAPLQLDDQTDLLELAERIKAATLQKFYLPELGYFSPMFDQQGIVSTLYLDTIWSLYFLEPHDLTAEMIESQFALLPRLQTTYGYLSRDRTPGATNVDDQLMVGRAVWPVEQMYLGLLAKRSGQNHHQIIAECEKAAAWLDISEYPDSEFIAIDNASDAPRIAGCNVQLWTIAYRYALEHYLT